MVEFGEQLKKAREAKGMTQQTLADQVYVTRQTISRWESGSRYPDIITLKKLSSILDVSTDSLLSNDEMVKAIEHMPIHEKKSMANNMTILLYGLSVFLIVIKSMVEFHYADFSRSPINEIYSYTIFTVLKNAFEVGIFSYSLYLLIREEYTTKMVGTTASLYFALEGLSGIGPLLRTFGLVPFLYRLVLMIPFFIGSFVSYKFFVMNDSKHLYIRLVYFSSLFGIARQLFIVINMHYYATDYMNLTYLLMAICTILIFITFIYQTYIVSRKRKNICIINTIE